MSGRKDYPITITSSQWEDMRRSVTTAENRASTAERNAQNAMRAETDAQIKIRDLQERSSREISGLNQELQNQSRNHTETLHRIENDFNSKIQQQNTNFQESLRQQSINFQESLRQQRIEFDRELRNSHANLQTQINDITQRMEAERQSQEQIASYWVNQAQNLLNNIDSKYRHRIFTSREWDRLNSELRDAHTDLNRRQYQAALSTARRICYQAIELQERVIASEWEWTQLYNYANSSLVGIKNRIESLNSLQYVEQEDGKQISIPAEIDFWSHGALSVVINEQQRLENIIRNNSNNLSSEDIRSIIEQIVTLDNRISEIDASARDNYCASQIRIELRTELGDRLPGWNIEHVLFTGDDKREDLHLILRHIDGKDRLSLIIRGGNQAQTNIISDYDCTSHNNADRHNRYVQELNQTIADIVGCRVNPISELRYQHQTSGDLRVFNVEEIRERKNH